MHHARFWPNRPSQSREEVYFIVFANFSIGDQLGFWNIFILKPCSLFMLHVKFENHRCRDFNSVEWTSP